MRQEKVIWFAIVFSTFIYAVLIWILAPNPEGTFSEAVQRHFFTPILYALAFVTFVMATVLPKVALHRAPARTRMIVTLALYEACAVYGLIAAFVSHDWRLFVPTWILSLIGMWRVYPSAELTAPA